MAIDSIPEYGRLLVEALPSLVRSEEQNDAYVERMAELLRREPELTAAERELAGLLTLLIEDFEDQHDGLPKASLV